MKKTLLIFLIIFCGKTFSQVIIAPYILYTDSKNKFATFLVLNESDEVYEIDISFVFGYPVTDSAGSATMKYFNEPDDSMPSATKWIRAFPRKFSLNPKERQTVRMTVNPPPGITSGTYWSRVVTSAAQQSPPIDTLSEGVRAQLKFVLNQVTTLLYRAEPTSAGVDVQSIYYDTDSVNANIYLELVRTGNSPFFGNITAIVTDQKGNIVAEEQQGSPIYFNMIKKFQFPLEKFSSGKYNVELKIVHNEKESFPESTLELVSPIIKYISIDIP